MASGATSEAPPPESPRSPPDRALSPAGCEQEGQRQDGEKTGHGFHRLPDGGLRRGVLE